MPDPRQRPAPEVFADDQAVARALARRQTTDAVITEIKDDKKAPAGGGMDDMGY